jgi:hypothetical protein
MKMMPTNTPMATIVRGSMSLLLDLTDREVEVIRMALRAQQDLHKRNGFDILVNEVSDLRSKIADAILDSKTPTRV